MSGHNKWSKIKHKKAASDAKKSNIFSKIVRLITVEAKKAGGDESAPGLRMAIEKAKEVNMPKENIERAVKKASDSSSEQMEEVIYETYGPGGCALIISGLTDNRNRTAAEIKHILSKQGFALAAPGSVTWAFNRSGETWIPQNTMELSDNDIQKLENLVEALEDNDDVQEVYTNVE